MRVRLRIQAHSTASGTIHTDGHRSARQDRLERDLPECSSVPVQRRVTADRMIVITRLPDCPGSLAVGLLEAAACLETLHAVAQRLTTKLSQPVKVIRHDDPGK